MKEKKDKEDIWDKKKIIIFLILIFVGGLAFFIAKEKYVDRPVSLDVKGESTQIEKPQIDIGKGINEKLSEIATDAKEIDFEEIASSSPQVQKVLNDLRSLQGYPKSQVKQMCERVCSNF